MICRMERCKKPEGVSHLWILLVVFVFAVMLVSAIIIMPIFFFAFDTHPELFTSTRPLMPVIGLFLISICIGTGMTGMLAKRFIAPVIEISQATKEVAKGNFDILINERHRHKEIKALAVNFNKMIRELSGIETLRGDFIVNVSHEFKTPLAAIEGYAALLRNGDLSDTEKEEYTRAIIENSSRLSTLTGNILKLSKLENQQIVVNKSRFALDEQLRRTLILLEKQWSVKNLQLDLDLPHLEYFGSEDLLAEVWLNLLGNAIKFTPEGGGIGIQLRSGEKAVEVEIKDNGIGMDEETQRHIFEKFYQGDETRAKEGNGLGLPLVRHILDICGGDIMVYSQPGQGSAFIVTLLI